MPLPLKKLDNRTFDQLVAEGRALLPRLAPSWTDHNYHDPGITLIDLFAWLVETDMFRLDRIFPAAHRTFLRLIGFESRLLQAAETVVVFTVRSGNIPVHLSKGAGVASLDGEARFRISRSVTVIPSQLTSVLAARQGALADCTEQNVKPDKRFAPLGADPKVDDALYLGFDTAIPAKSARVILHVWVHSCRNAREVRQQLRVECKARRSISRSCRSCRSSRCDSSWQHYSARTVWEYYAKPVKEAEQWLPLAGVFDETHGLTLGGTVRFTMPAEPHVQGGVESYHDQYFIRCRLIQGYYECPPEINRIAVNAVMAIHSKTVNEEEKQSDSNGHPGQTFQLRHRPVIPGSTRLRVMVDGSSEDWHEVQSWDRVRPHDRVYHLEPETGQITFGNGLHGKVPKADAKISVRSYECGGGHAGNVRAGTLTTYQGIEPVTLEQPFAAAGGSEAETLVEAKGRAMTWLTEPRRAVTVEDFEAIALSTPGVPVRRAHALADFHPALPGLPALGSVTVVVVPSCAQSIPEPGPDMLRAVRCYLDRRRLATTELHVISPNFITVAVRATLHAEVESDVRSLITEAQSKLNSFLDPFRGGADGEGWPMGRDVYRSEVMALLNAIPGVSYVDDISLVVESGFEVYQGHVRWMEVFNQGDTLTSLHAQLRIEPDLPASRLVEQARAELESSFRSPHGRSRHISPEAHRHEVRMILAALPGVISVEEARIEDGEGSGTRCGNVQVCAHSLVVPGRHQIIVSSAGTGRRQIEVNGAVTGKHVRTSQQGCFQCDDARRPKR